jgi:Isochorismatase family
VRSSPSSRRGRASSSSRSRYDAFYGTSLDHELRVRGIETLVVCGTVANICVHYTAAGAAIRWYRVHPVDALSALGPFDLEVLAAPGDVPLRRTPGDGARRETPLVAKIGELAERGPANSPSRRGAPRATLRACPSPG